jgi:hypothetical protein
MDPPNFALATAPSWPAGRAVARFLRTHRSELVLAETGHRDAIARHELVSARRKALERGMRVRGAERPLLSDDAPHSRDARAWRRLDRSRCSFAFFQLPTGDAPEILSPNTRR